MKTMKFARIVAGIVSGVALGLGTIPTRAALLLVETGPVALNAPNNLATQPGAVAFAQDVIAGGTPDHQIPHLNDGLYGNAHSWIGDVDPSFAGIDLGGSFEIYQIAFGRDNNAALDGFAHTDRVAGVYDIQYTTVPNPDETTPNGSWISLGVLNYTSSPPPSPALRHLYQFTPLVATGIRILVDGDGIPAAIAIDELEVYATVPEPSVAGLLLVGGWLVLRRRK